MKNIPAITIILCCLALTSCVKDKAPKTELLCADSTYVGKLETYVASAFNSESVKWDFGDGTVSEDFNALHIYRNPGTYTVSMRPDGLYAMTKNVKVLYGISRMNNKRNWSGADKQIVNSVTSTTTNDTSFAITFANDSTIQLPDFMKLSVVQLNYKYNTDTTKKFMLYAYSDGADKTASLSYYYKNDSLVLISNSGNSTNGRTITYHTK